MAETADVLLRGLSVARDVVLEDDFLQFEQPLPVGTRLVVKVSGESREAVVRRVVEKSESEATAMGMEVSWETSAKKSSKSRKASQGGKAADAPMEVVGEFKTQRYGDKEIPVPSKKGGKKKK